MKKFSKTHQNDLTKLKNFFGYSWRHTLTLLLALVVTVTFTHTALADEQTVKNIGNDVTVKNSATITPTPTAFASAVNVTTTTVPATKVASGDQTALTVKAITRTTDTAAEEAAAKQSTTATRRIASSARLVTSTARSTSSTRNNTFASGYCTDWAARQTGWVDWRGNAKAWGSNAAANGHKVGKEYAAAGSIVQTRESSYGHVAYVKEVKGNQVTISEMNYKGRGVVSERTLNINDPKIVTFIQK